MLFHPLLCALVAISLSTPALADLDHRRIRIAGYDLLNHLLVIYNPNLHGSLSNRDAHQLAYRTKLTELEHLTERSGDTNLIIQFVDMKDRISRLETAGNAESYRLANWVNPVISAQSKLDATARLAEQQGEETDYLVSDILLRVARVNFYYQLSTFSGLSIPLLRDASDPISALDSEILQRFQQAERQLPACGEAIRQSLAEYRFIRTGLLDYRSAWIHDSIDRYTSNISSTLSPLLIEGSCEARFRPSKTGS